MFSLQELNTTMAVYTAQQNQTSIYMLGLMGAVGNATFTAVCGGSAEEITKAFEVGFIAGLGAGALVCGLVMINVLAIAEAGAFLAAAAFGASLANVVLLSVLTVYSVASGNEQKLMTYVSLLSTALMGLCVTYGAYGEVTVSGDKGSKTISICDYQNICKKSVHNQGKNKVMLGKYDGGGENSYITKAGNDYEYFNLGNDWEIIKSQYGFDDMDMFKLFNEPFLDNGISARKIFYFSHNPQNDGGALGLEFNYLKQNHYIWDEKNMSMSPKY